MADDMVEGLIINLFYILPTSFRDILTVKNKGTDGEGFQNS